MLRGRGKIVCAVRAWSPAFKEMPFFEPSRTMFGLHARRHFINLGKFTGTGALVKFINRFLGEILSSGDVDGFEPASFAPAPGRAGRHTHLLKPPGQADDCRAGDRIRFAV